VGEGESEWITAAVTSQPQQVLRKKTGKDKCFQYLRLLIRFLEFSDLEKVRKKSKQKYNFIATSHSWNVLGFQFCCKK
jgi:hypothetical protein